MPTLTFLFNRVLEILAREIGKEKEIKDFQTGKEEEIKLLFFFFADDMILHIKTPKDSQNTARTSQQVQ